MNLQLTLLKEVFAVSKLHPSASIPLWATESSFFSMTRTLEELSIVTSQQAVPPALQRNKGRRALKVQGMFL